jgi:hypothetical protein
MRKILLVAAFGIIFLLTASPAKVAAQQAGLEKGYAMSGACLVPYKTNEEIAWELFRYALNNVPEMKLGIDTYEKFLDAYRKALNMLKEPGQPIPPAQKK